MKIFDMGINQNIPDRCGVREEGCRAMAKRKVHLKFISCILVVTQVDSTKLEWLAPASLGELLAKSLVTGNTRSESDVCALSMLQRIITQRLILFEGR